MIHSHFVVVALKMLVLFIARMPVQHFFHFVLLWAMWCQTK